MTNPEPKCPVCGEGEPFEHHGHPRREDFTPPIPGLASISDEKVLWLFDQLAAANARAERAEARVKELENKIVACGYCEEAAGWHNITVSQIEQRCERYCPDHEIHSESRVILANRKKEESK